jgi:diguanylate cyclase (GGDEF)-like protein
MIRHITVDDLELCLEQGKRIMGAREFHACLARLFGALDMLVPSESSTVYLYDSERGRMTRAIRPGVGISDFRERRLYTMKGIAGAALKSLAPVKVRGIEKCRVHAGEIEMSGVSRIKSMIAVPMRTGQLIVGALELINPGRSGVRETEILMTLADFAAVGIDNSMLFSRTRDHAMKDGLTGLYNTRYLYQELEEMLGEMKRNGSSLSIVFMDLDHFKSLVDAFGHLHGSQAIQEVAGTIMDEIHGPEFAVSYGGDEFVVVLPDCGRKEAMKRAQRIHSRMARTVYLSNRGLSVNISASYGIATFPDDAMDSRQLLNIADRALFTMKSRGKNGICQANEL